MLTPTELNGLRPNKLIIVHTVTHDMQVTLNTANIVGFYNSKLDDLEGTVINLINSTSVIVKETADEITRMFYS